MCADSVWCADTSTQPNMDPESHCLAEAVLRGTPPFIMWAGRLVIPVRPIVAVCIRGITYLCVCVPLNVLRYWNILLVKRGIHVDDAPTPCDLPLTPCTGLPVGQCAASLLRLLRNCPRKVTESLVSPPGFKLLHIWIWLSHYYTATTLYCTHDLFLSLHLSVVLKLWE